MPKQEKLICFLCCSTSRLLCLHTTVWSSIFFIHHPVLRLVLCIWYWLCMLQFRILLWFSVLMAFSNLSLWQSQVVPWQIKLEIVDLGFVSCSSIVMLSSPLYHFIFCVYRSQSCMCLLSSFLSWSLILYSCYRFFVLFNLCAVVYWYWSAARLITVYFWDDSPIQETWVMCKCSIMTY